MRTVYDKSSKLTVDGAVLEQAKFLVTAEEKIGVRVGNEPGSPLYVTPTDDVLEDDIFIYDDTANINKDTETKIIDYIVPPTKTLNLNRIECSGENISRYTVKINSATNKVKRSYYGDSLNVVFQYDSYELTAGDQVEVFVIHHQDMTSDYDVTIEGKLK